MEHNISHFEKDRLEIQTILDNYKTKKERNCIGQFATPTSLAREIVYYGLNLLPSNETIKFIDPAIGTGSFYSALLAVIRDQQVSSACGFEIDELYASSLSKLWGSTSLKIKIEDFTKATPQKEMFNLLICNPPYVRHHHLTKENKHRLQNISSKGTGIQLSGLSGLYCYFIALSYEWMSPGGVAGWLIPSEFMDVNYGKEIKKFLLNKVNLLRIHRFNPKDVQFDDALVSSSVVWFKKEKPSINNEVEFSYGGSLLKPDISRKILIEELRPELKWSSFYIKRTVKKEKSIKLSELFEIKRGIATGANNFFILDSEKIKQLKLPWKLFRPILPSPRYIKGLEINSDKNGNPILKNPLFLLDCNLPESEIRNNYPTLWDYLKSGESEISNRYLCKSRRVWYQQEVREPSLFVFTYMSRIDNLNKQPFRFLLNNSRAIVSNSYLMLYPKAYLKNKLSDVNVIHQVWQYLNNIQADIISNEGRVYGGGLYKVEPKELCNIPVNKLAELLDIQV